ncbi:hypothetical protein evm_007935 [Chilo suppressalis]|nr:hypothetical protein evm_007935 [Chilo suppressalis]
MKNESTEAPISMGVPQFFLVYINDLPHFTRDLCETVLYADDTSLVFKASRGNYCYDKVNCAFSNAFIGLRDRNVTIQCQTSNKEERTSKLILLTNKVLKTNKMVNSAFLTFLIIFATSEARRTNFKEAKMPAACEGKTYCHEKSPDYPQTLIDSMIRDLDIKIINTIDMTKERDGTPSNIVCANDPKFAPIYEIYDTKGYVRYVVQSDNAFVQMIRTEACLNKGEVKESSVFERYQIETFNVTCHEKRIKYQFRVLSLDGITFETVEVKDGLPVCCSCQVKLGSDGDHCN